MSAFEIDPRQLAFWSQLDAGRANLIANSRCIRAGLVRVTGADAQDATEAYLADTQWRLARADLIRQRQFVR